MGAIGGLLGLAGGLGGAGQVNSGTNAGQINGANTSVENSIFGQNQLLNALQGQNGLQNQSNVYNQLQGVVSGQGPNPAQAQLAQATGANVANQAALMAGQRGAGANAGLLARQNAMQGGALQQQAAGQGATMQANQSLNALGQAAGQANTMAGQQIGQTNAVNAAQQAHQNTLMGANQAANQVQGQLAGQQMQGMAGLLGGVMNAAGGASGMLGGTKKAEGGMIDPQGPQSLFAKSMSAPMAQGGNVGESLKAGGPVPGQAKVAGDSYANDHVKALLSPGEIVIPRSVVQSQDPIRGAAQFVQATLAKKKAKA